ncbi:MAG: hypothetical protein RL357_775 [Pseudomonadota bacterium]
MPNFITGTIQMVRQQWFRELGDESLLINDVAVRIRAGILLIIPLYMAYTLASIVWGSHWEVTGNYIKDTYELDFDDRILYHVEAVRRVYDYTVQTWVLLYAMFEMLAGMWRTTSRLSPTIYLATILARHHRPVWKPLIPKRFAWTIGASLIAVCLVFFNPDTFAGWVNWVAQTELLPTTTNYMPRWIPLVLVWVCLGFMWMETVLGVCAGCQIHALLVWMGLIKHECEACNNLTWD